VQNESTAYDSPYVVLAHRLSLPFVTSDERLASRFAKAELDVRFLGD